MVGTSPRQVLIRAAGPGLLPFSVTNYLKVPKLVLYNNDRQVIQTNTGWDSSLLQDFARVGAFPFALGSSDSAFLVTLAPGTYTVQVTDGGTGEGGDALIEVYDAGSSSDTSSRLKNLSARGTVSPAGTLIGGLVVSGTTPKTMLVRGIGPTLANFNVAGVLADPIVSVYDRDGNVLATNNDWSVSSNSTVSSSDYAAGITAANAKVGAFQLDPNSTDAALIVTLQPGTYTIQLRGANGSAGAGLIEVYELP